MGMFDTFVSLDGTVQIQLKVGPCLMHEFTEGETISSRDFPDAVYYAPDGVVVIEGGQVKRVAEGRPTDVPPHLPAITKWGGAFNRAADIQNYHPFRDVMAAHRRETEDEEQRLLDLWADGILVMWQDHQVGHPDETDLVVTVMPVTGDGDLLEKNDLLEQAAIMSAAPRHVTLQTVRAASPEAARMIEQPPEKGFWVVFQHKNALIVRSMDPETQEAAKKASAS